MSSLRIARLITAAVTLGLAASSARAENLTGSRILAAGGVVTWYGDEALDRVTGPGYGLSTGFNQPLAPGLDLKVHVDGYEASGEDAGLRIDSDGRSCGLDAILWCPDKAASSFRPQLDLGLEYDDVSTTTEEAGVREEEDDEDVGLSASIGTEITPAAGGLWSMISAGYHWYDNSDWLSVQGNAGYWCTDRLLLSTGVQYDFDVEDVSLNLELSCKL